MVHLSVHRHNVWLRWAPLSLAELKLGEPKLRGYRGRAGGLLPEPADRPALRPHQLCSRHQPGGSVRNTQSMTRHLSWTSNMQKISLFHLHVPLTHYWKPDVSASNHACFLQTLTLQGAPEPVMPRVTWYWRSVFGVEAGGLDHPMAPEHGTAAAHCSLGAKCRGQF